MSEQKCMLRYGRELLLMLAYVLISCDLTAQEMKQADELVWNGPSMLKESDFRQVLPKSKGPSKSFSGAHRSLEGYIYCGIYFSFKSHGPATAIMVYAFMKPDHSWLRDAQDKETLLHEQAHFNIAEIYARLLRGRLKEIKNAGAAQRIYKKCFNEMSETQRRFDNDHDGENSVSPEWQEWISAELNRLEKYSYLNYMTKSE